MADDASLRVADDPKNDDLFLAIDIIIDTTRNELTSGSLNDEEE
jgi:hypothetical protein